MEKMIMDLLKFAKLGNNFVVSSGILYLITKESTNITIDFDNESNVEYKEVINIRSKEICNTSNIVEIGYDLKTINIITTDYKITINSAWCNIMPV
jgi:ribosomal protein S4E